MSECSFENLSGENVLEGFYNDCISLKSIEDNSIYDGENIDGVYYKAFENCSALEVVKFL